jgi:2-oxoglutarate dehydrogenase E2 component (dihydrolipoamide succinyltransferase)
MTNVVMPQMGESVAEGTVVRWIKKVGDAVDRDEPLFEISTDKVDAEIPSPVAGVLTDIKVKEGETVPVDSVVAVISAPEEVAASPGAPATAAAAAASDRTAAQAPAPHPHVVEPKSPDGDSRPAAAAEASIPAEAGAPRRLSATAEARGGAVAEPSVPVTVETERDQLRRTRSSPLVRRIAQEHHIDLSTLHGSGVGGRVTKQDILQHLNASGATVPEGAPLAQFAPEVRAPEPALRGEPTAAGAEERVEVAPMSVMRKKIAEHMVLSLRTSAHVYSVFDVDFHRVSRVREEKKGEYERIGTKLTYLAFIAKAVCDALRAVPVVNASVDGESIVYRKDIHLGIAVALDWGLVVPVVRNADEKNLLGLSRAIADLAQRARAKHLRPEEVHGGTFTITNPGTFGTLFGMPIINQPQVAILGVGAIEKRVVVIDDAIHVRPRAYLSLGYDHRIIDGAVADQFMSHLKRALEQFDPAAA